MKSTLSRQKFEIFLTCTSTYGNHYTVQYMYCSLHRSVAVPGCVSRIPDPNFSIPDPGSENCGSRIRIRIKEVFLILNTVSMLSEKLSGMFNVHPGSGFFSFPDPGVKKAATLLHRCSYIFCTYRTLNVNHLDLSYFL